MTAATPSTEKRRGRPKRDPQTAEARQKLIRTGLIHLTERGYSSVGVDEILKSSGVPKGSFYHYFQNKADYGSQLIDAYNDYFIGRLNEAFSDEDLSPLNQFRAFTTGAIERMAHHGFRRGCLVGNLGQEMGALPKDYRAKLIDVLSQWETLTADCLQRAQASKEIPNSKDPKALASFFWIGWEGAVLRAKLERSPKPLTDFTETFFIMLTT